MGLGGISIGQLLIILVIVLLIFGGKRLRGLGNDLGTALKSFRKAMNDEEQNTTASAAKSENNPDKPTIKPLDKQD